MPSAVPIAAEPPRIVRRLVIGTALLLALAVAVLPRTPVHAQGTPPAPPAAAVPAPRAPDAGAAPKDRGTARSATVNIKADDRSVTIDAKTDKDPDASVDEDTDASEPIVGIGKGKHGKRVRVTGFGNDHEYDSFNDFARAQPELAFLIFMIVAVVFLTPVLVIALVLWYRMRKQRMLNETMLRLAEKGVVPPAEALGALAGNASSPLAAAPSASPLVEQAKQMRRRAAWSDLRKGVILGGIGLGLTFYSMLDDGTPNGIGLVLLFVGIGYMVLWWYEERQIAPKAGGAGAAPAGPLSGGTDGKG